MPPDEPGSGTPDIATILQQSAAMTQLASATNSQAEAERNLQKSIEDRDKAFKRAADEISEFATSVPGLTLGVAALGGAFDNMFNQAKATAWLQDLGKNAFGFLKDFAVGINNALGPFFEQAQSLFKAYLAPLESIYGVMVEKAAELLNNTALAQARENVRKNFGDLARAEAKSVINAYDDMRKSAGSLAGTTLSMSKVFGRGPEGAAAALEYFNQVAFAMGSTFSVLRNEIEKMGDSFLIYQKGLGLTDEQMKAIGTKAIATGRPIEESLKDISRLAVTMGSKFNMSSKLIGRDLGYMMSNVAKFGSLTKTQMATSAVYTRALGLEIKDLEGLIDKFDDFESAATGASKLAQAFGMNVDALKMMKEQDPAKRLDMLRQSFAATGRSIESMSRQERLLLAETSGLDAGLVEAALSAKNMGKSYEDIQKESQKSGKEQKSQAEIMESLSKNIERVVQSMNVQASLIGEFVQGFAEGIAMSLGFKDGLKGIMEGLRTMRQLGRQIGEVFATYFPGVKDMFVSIGDTVRGLTGDLRSFTSGVGGAAGGLGDFFANFETAEGAQDSIQMLFGEVESSGNIVSEGTRNSFSKVFENYNKFLRSILNAITASIPFVASKAVEFLGSFVDSMTGAATDPANQESVASAVADLFGAINDAWKSVEPRLVELVGFISKWFTEQSNDPDSFISKLFTSAEPVAQNAGDSMIVGLYNSLTDPKNLLMIQDAVDKILFMLSPGLGATAMLAHKVQNAVLGIPGSQPAAQPPPQQTTAVTPPATIPKSPEAAAVANQSMNEVKIRSAMKTIKELKVAEEAMKSLQNSLLVSGLWDQIITKVDDWYTNTFLLSPFFTEGGAEYVSYTFGLLEPVISTFQRISAMMEKQIEPAKIDTYFASTNKMLNKFVEQRNFIIEKNMVETVTAASRDLIEMHNALNDVPEIDVRATIDKLGKKLSLSNEVLKVEKKPLVLNVSLDLTMKAEDITKEIFKTDAKLRKTEVGYEQSLVYTP